MQVGEVQMDSSFPWASNHSPQNRSSKVCGTDSTRLIIEAPRLRLLWPRTRWRMSNINCAEINYTHRCSAVGPANGARREACK